ncbi:Tubulin beta chain [Hondaea fermentalgiana]|uniref:Tubulin beta chain n=1 Tax=Hondaea fermentalgiana TaxID=2315210 RepID=A0A2R5G8J6_9STRA|nr:Tubulin beta chain [Hondaea fermentalgiana]|eukprot:GBG26865.1 Tubulin beta chain [Hondaea fermentalgiana]
MPREVVTVQVGQCGNQVGRSFWGRVLREHAAASEDGCFDAPMSTYFRNVNARTGAALDDVNAPISSLRARAVLIDTEEGVLAQTLSGPLRELFDEHEFIRGVSGAGNNFAHGFHGYGNEYAERIAEALRREAERYCVFPMSNEALMDAAKAASTIESRKVQKGQRPNRLGAGAASSKGGEAFDEMNGVAAQMISNLTCCARFPGKMNLDLSELTTNLVPFPRMQFLNSAISPLAGDPDRSSRVAQKQQVDRMFAGAMARSNQLLKTDPVNGRFLACAMLVRGHVNLADIHRNVERLGQQIELPSWNQDAFKIGLCAARPADQHHSMISLANNSCVRGVFAGMEERFRTLYGPRRKAYIHHYTNFMEEGHFDVALETLASLQHDYSDKFDEAERIAADARPPCIL